MSFGTVFRPVRRTARPSHPNNSPSSIGDWMRSKRVGIAGDPRPRSWLRYVARGELRTAADRRSAGRHPGNRALPGSPGSTDRRSRPHRDREDAEPDRTHSAAIPEAAPGRPSRCRAQVPFVGLVLDPGDGTHRRRRNARAPQSRRDTSAPVRRHLRAVLPDGAPIDAAATVEQVGTFEMGETVAILPSQACAGRRWTRRLLTNRSRARPGRRAVPGNCCTANHHSPARAENRPASAARC